jgi:hypothetical protein
LDLSRGGAKASREHEPMLGWPPSWVKCQLTGA